MATKDFNVSILKAAGALVLAMMLAGCGSGGDSSIRELAGAGAISTTAAQPTPPATAAPLPPSPAPTQPPQQPQVIEVTRPVEVTRQVVDVQQVEVTRIVEVIITPTPDIAGFQDSGIDESAQPCPARYWKRNRCIATDAQIDAYAHEVQP